MLDSGAFSELAANGKWTISAAQYAGEVARFDDEIGNLVQVAPQDWMCEPGMLRKTGHSVAKHQALTVQNYLDLVDLGMTKVFPVLQGWTLPDYHRHIELYADSGVYLDALPLVGIGSVCRRQGEDEISTILHAMATEGLNNLHGFGVKLQGLDKGGCCLRSADSMAWSYAARRRPPLQGCSGHINCANCETYALQWRDKVLALVGRSTCAICH